MSKPLLIVLIAKSGCGKSTIAHKLERKYNLKQVKSYTTRPMRDNAEDVNTHTFITMNEVEKYRDDMVAWNQYNSNFYFCTRNQLAESQIYVCDKQGLIQLFSNYTDKDIIVYHIKCDSSITAKRMSDRGDSDEQIRQRLEYDMAAFDGVEELCDFSFTNENQNQMNDIVEHIYMTYEGYVTRSKNDD